MPVTLSINNHEAEGWRGKRSEQLGDLFKRTCYPETRVFQSPITRQTLKERYTTEAANGFVCAAYYTYSSHRHLTIRPEDVWFSILTQMSSYINANAEELRSYFVEHDDKKELVVTREGAIDTVDLGAMAEDMTHMIDQNVKDPELRTWFMPLFSTTSNTDRVVASVLFMGAMQKYFSYTFRMACGIPSVTLLGEVADWQDTLVRIDKLEEPGEEPRQFAEMLRPILKYFIQSFQQPGDPSVVDFWNKVVTRDIRGSGMHYISGWISAFCFWSEEGVANSQAEDREVLDGVSYPLVGFATVPAGCSSVPVKVIDNGVLRECTMAAGSFGMQALPPIDSGLISQGETISVVQTSDKAASSSLSTLRPLSGWFMFESSKKDIKDENEYTPPMNGDEDKKARRVRDKIDCCRLLY